MKTIHVPMDDEEYYALVKKKDQKGAKSWLQFMRMVK